MDKHALLQAALTSLAVVAGCGDDEDPQRAPQVATVHAGTPAASGAGAPAAGSGGAVAAHGGSAAGAGGEILCG